MEECASHEEGGKSSFRYQSNAYCDSKTTSDMKITVNLYLLKVNPHFLKIQSGTLSNPEPQSLPNVPVKFLKNIIKHSSARKASAYAENSCVHLGSCYYKGASGLGL